jgi:hypothetical protein
MLRFLKELYLTMFTLGFRFRIGDGLGPTMDAGKGVLLICVIILFIFNGIKSYIEIYVGTRFNFDSALWERAAIILAIYLPNNYILDTCGHGIKFEREFTNLKKSRKVLLVMSCAMVLLATIVFGICSDSAYRHFFQIPQKN